MGKQAAKDGVGQPQLQIVFPSENEGETSHRTGETENNGPPASTAASAARKEAERKQSRRKWYSLIDKVYALPNLQRAWQQVAKMAGPRGSMG
jgi:hypothetical protein